MKSRLIATYVLSLLDLAFTMYLQFRFGDIEANPVGRLLLGNVFWAVLYKVGFVGGCLLVLYKLQNTQLAVVGSWVIFAAFAALTVYHVAIVANAHCILFIK